MTIAETDLAAFGQLTRALGITTGSETNAQWFTDPVGGSTQNPTGLKTILSNDSQRTALVDFVDEVLGPPAATTRAETTWLPLFRNSDPAITLYAVLTPVAGAVHLGVGAEHSTSDTGPRVTTRVHAPLFRVPRGTGALPNDTSSLPDWLLLGRPDGRVAIEVDATFTDAAPVPGEAHLGGLSAGIEVPTDGVSDVGFTLTLRDLQIPGALTPSSPTLDLDSLDELGEDVFSFAVGLLHAQLAALDTSDDGLRIAAGLSGLLGLREVPDLPPFPLADLPERGVAAITDWVRDVLGDNDARDAWLGQLALLTTGSLRADQDAVAFSLGPAELLLGLRVTPGSTSQLVLVPWLRLDLEASPGAVVTLSADLLRADTASGTVTALPGLDLLAVFGHPAGTPKLLATGPVRIGALRVGIALDGNRHPAPRLTLHDVDLAADTASPSHHDVLDLSSPDAALAAVDSVVSDLLTGLLDDLGPAGSLLGAALGVAPPADIAAISVAALLADPLAALTTYWRSVLASPAAGREVFGDLAHLLSGTPTGVAGDGTASDPWLLPLHPSLPVAVAVSVAGDMLTLAVSAAPTHTLTDTALGDVLVSAELAAELLRLDLAAPAASFLTGFTAAVRLAPADTEPFHLPLGIADLEVGALGLDVQWRPTTGLWLTPIGELSLVWSELGPPMSMALPLPTRAADGTLTFAEGADGSGLNMSGLELALGRLLLAPELSAIHPVVHLLGWSGDGPRLSLSALIDNPAAALEGWAADLALDCGHLHTTMSALAMVLSASVVSTPYGFGRKGAPYHAPVGGHPGLPGLSVWTDPPCPRPTSWGGWSGFDPGPAPDPQTLVAALADVADSLPELADLLMARPGLDIGLESLLTRCTGTDGLVAGSTGVPASATAAVLPGYGYAEARAASVLDPLPYLGMGTAPAPRVHLVTDRSWWAGQDAGTRIDATDLTSAQAPTLPATGDGPYFVLLPAVTAAGPGLDGIAEQAERIASTLRERTTAVTLVAHGGPGAAALRAAARADLSTTVGAVVTVGTPWSAVPTATFIGQGGGALTFLTALLGIDLPEFSDDHLAHFSGPLSRGFGLLRRMSQERTTGDLPNAAVEVIRPGLTVHAVSGALSRADLTASLTALIEYAVQRRITGLGEAAGQATAAEGEDGADGVRELHAGLALPALDLTLGPISLGVAADLSLLSVHRDIPRVRTEQILTTALRFGISDGWLLGGPGATQRDLEVRWVEVLLYRPLEPSGAPARCELVLHEARAYTAYRERWVVAADTLDPSATLALPEVKLILAAVATRIHAEAPALASLLTTYGLFRDGGLDPTGLDRLLFDTGAFLAAPMADPVALVAALRAVLGTPAGPTPSTLRLTDSATATLDIDLATGSVLATATTATDAGAGVSGAVSVTSAGVNAEITLGSSTPTGAVLVSAAMGAGGPTVALEITAPGYTTTVPLYPAPADSAVLDLLRIALPMVAGKAALDALRGALSGSALATLDSALAALGLLDPDLSHTRVPVGLLLDPGSYLRAQVSPLATAVAVLDAAAALIVPDRSGDGWPLTDDVSLTYELVAGRLELTAHVNTSASVDTADVEVEITGGLSIDTSGAARAVLTAAASVDGYGVLLRVGQSATAPVHLDLLRPAPGTPLAIYPPGSGLGAGLEFAGAAAQAAVVVALNELIARRGAGSSTIQQVGTVADHLALGLDLVADPASATHVLDAGRVSAFAVDPGGRLLARLPQLSAHLLASIAAALGSTEITAAPVGTATRIAYQSGGSGGAGGPSAYLELDGAAATVRLGARIDLGTLGVISIDEISISAVGVSVAVTAGPILVDLDAVQLFPVITVHAGIAGPTFERGLGVGLATSATGDAQVQVQWALDATPPQVVAITAGLPTTDPATVATRALGLAMSIASGVIAEQLATVLTTEVTAKLQGVVFTGGAATIDPGFIEALLDPEALLQRLYTLAWNCAAVGTPISVTIEDLLVIGLTAVPVGPSSAGRKHLGLRLSLPDGARIPLVQGSLTVELECEASWVIAAVQPGLSILVLEGTATDLELSPGVVVAGLGVRFTSDGAPLLDLGSVSIDGIAVRIYGEASGAGVGGGAQVVLDGLSLAPGGGGGSNQLANGIMNDVGESSGNARPTFSPAIAVQKPPGQDVAVSLRAGDPPGPWWLVIQRQLGPLYVDRIGFDAVESDRRVTRISLLFTGQIELFGLTAAVDQLSLSWNGGDVLSISSWSVDLMGLAISADMAGVSISGGLLKIVEGTSTSYIGMLTGRFAAYGLSVFGGFTQDGANASFFLFGGFNGPIGGPPAFFLTGIAGGLGINRGLRSPEDLSQFGSYPFIAALNPAAPQQEPMQALRELSEYFPHQVGTFWFAGGISFTCFSLIDGIAVLAVSFGPGGLDISLFGLARLALPRPGAALVSIELALVVRFSMSEGVFMIRAQLTDNSWLLYPEIRLTGGFAFAIWWKGPLAGQFVLTLGGYHPSFHVEGYPDVPRLGLVWRISDVLVIKGGSYFALTSEALMAGQSVEASLDLGWVWAKVTFGADGIVYFDPFSFDVRVYCRISAGIHLDLWLVTISFSISISAEIHVWGPDFAGVVTFEIGPASVPIRFGSRRRVEPEMLDWLPFVDKYLERGSGSTARALTAITGRGTLPTSTKGDQTSQGAPSSDGTAALPFRVFAEFEITITTSIPARKVVIGSSITEVSPTLAGAASTLGIAPMGLRDLAARLVVHLDRKAPDGSWSNVNASLAALAAGITTASGPAELTTSAFPLGVFGAPSSSSSNSKLPNHDVVVAPSQLTLVAGIAETAPGPLMDYYRVEAKRRPLPLQATRLTRASMVNLGRTMTLPLATTAGAALAQAQQLLFEHGHEPHSALARASFTGDRAAPPMFGSLTDGLVADNGADGARERLPVSATTAITPRRPVVVGFLGAGDITARRPAATTVANRRLKRRPAPTTASVRSRLSTRLPVTLTGASPAVAELGGRLAATSYVPRTTSASTGTAVRGGRLDAADIQGLVGGLGVRAGLVPRAERARRLTRAQSARQDELSQSIVGGDIVALEFLDARYDGDPRRRPSLKISGTARVLAMAGASIAADVEVDARQGEASVVVPPGTTLLAVHAGGDIDPEHGYAGWHDGSRVARLGDRVALAAGCALSVDGVADDRGQGVAWQPAHTLTGGARQVLTRFTRPVRSIAVALEQSSASSPDGTGTTPQDLRASTDLGLAGATIARDADGEQPPILVVIGAVSVLVYAVEPDPDTTGVAVTVTNGETWSLVGVVGADESPQVLAARIAESSMATVVSRVTAAAGTLTLGWQDARRIR